MPSQDDLPVLAARTLEGDSDAWATIYSAMAPAIFRLCRRVLPTRQDAEDATAEVFLKARLHLHQYDRERAFEPWIYRVAANHCWDELRKKRPGASVEDAEAELAKLETDAPSPQEAVLVKETRRTVRRAVEALDDRSRLVIALRYFADMRYDEIGDVLGVSGNFVGVLLLRARRNLRRMLS